MKTAKGPYRTERLRNKMAGCIFPLSQPRNIVKLKEVQWREKIITGIFMLMLILFLTSAEDARPEILHRVITGGSAHPFYTRSCCICQERIGSRMWVPPPKASSWRRNGFFFCNSSALYEKL